jgi:hypothetical protein
LSGVIYSQYISWTTPPYFVIYRNSWLFTPITTSTTTTKKTTTTTTTTTTIITVSVYSFYNPILQSWTIANSLWKLQTGENLGIFPDFGLFVEATN